MVVELSVLLAVAIIGQSTFAVFEVEVSPLRKMLKWGIVVAVTLGLAQVIGHWSVAVPLAAGVVGVIGHTIWCRRQGIDPLRATPRRKYYALRGWTWQE